MKTSIALCGAALLLSTAQFARAGVIAGPITNPANGHDYYLLAPANWSASEAEAENLGGTLAIIRNAAEQKWVLATFGSYGETNRNLWIGLHRSRPGGSFIWVTGVPLDYSNWEHGQPDNNNGKESNVHMFGHVPNRIAGTWNDLDDVDGFWGTPNCGVVEVPGKSNEKTLTENEKKLVGTWYVSGDADRPCWIAGAENKLFQICDRRATRLISMPDGGLFITEFQRGIFGEIVKDKILWSNGVWWSRKPAEYERAAASRESVREKTALNDQ